MFFFTNFNRYLPDSLTPSTAFYTRASFGTLAAYSAAFNPIIGIMVLLAHGAWECAGFAMNSVIDLQQQRINI